MHELSQAVQYRFSIDALEHLLACLLKARYALHKKLAFKELHHYVGVLLEGIA